MHVTSDQLGALKDAICEAGTAALDGLQTDAEGTFALHRAEIDQLFSGDSVEDIVAALREGSAWARRQAQTLAAKSPLTMKLAHRQLRKGSALGFRDIMKMEYRLTSRLIKTPNFQEGIRAVLVDRDNDPKWQPATLGEITERDLDAFFAALGPDDLDFAEIE